MGKFAKYLLVSDFDRTLTDHKGDIPQANLDAIRYFMDEGGAFTISTGRSLPMARYRFQDIPMNAPLLVYNGAMCYDLKTNETLFCYGMPESVMPLMQYYEQAYPDLRFEVHGIDKHYVFHENKFCDEFLDSQHADYAYVPWSEVPQPVLKFILSTRAEDFFSAKPGSETDRFFEALTQDIRKRGGEDYYVLHSLPNMVEVQVAGTSKGISARELARDLHRPILVCAGDAVNDETMLVEADLAFMPADGDPMLLAKGYRRAAHSQEGTIADIIRQLEAGL